ncbi:MAG: HPr family phosphocarrier protein [Blastocatellia bacterium]|nr:HPr family phosphocarrier protein [Blastocatellia bacterium]
MNQHHVRITNRLGFHARAAARFVNLANQFNCEVKLERLDNHQTADGKSILAILLLAASRGVELAVTVTGDDEDRALSALCGLIENKFGEEAELY